MTPIDDARRTAPATYRNRDPILGVLRTVLPDVGKVLEVASGTGEHVVHFARHLPDLDWQPSDPSVAARASIASWTAAEGLANVRPPIDLDASRSPWPVEHVAAVLCINMTHISPWEATFGLMRGAAQVLSSAGTLYLYGPFRRPGRSLEPSNESFDCDLRAQDPRWGLRSLDVVIRCAADHGLVFEQAIEMPANNLSAIFKNG